MKTIHIHGRGSPETLIYEETPKPHPTQGEVLVRVYAAGVIAPELTWDITYQTSAGQKRALPVPGHDVSGVVEEVGPGVPDINVGSDVYAFTALDRDGSAAEYMIALPSELAPKPRSLDYTQAASVPLTALTAWQAFFDHANLSAGQTILIHGAAGGVGVFAVQLAHWVGAHVIATASPRNHDFLRELGADEVIDYTSTRFEDIVHDADVVLDTIGGDTVERSRSVLKKEGVLVSLTTPPSTEQAQANDIRYIWFIVVPNREQLISIGELIDTGQIKPIIDKVFPLAQASEAYEQGKKGHTRGKIVLRVHDE